MTAGRAPGDASAPLSRRLVSAEPIDLPLTLAPLRHGRTDPTVRLDGGAVWLARRTEAGPATLRLRGATAGGAILAEAWGPGAELALQAAAGLAGLCDVPAALEARHPLLRELQRRFRGVRLPRTDQLLPALVPAICEQKVTSIEAHRAYAGIVRLLGEPAPGPAGLLLPPSAERLAGLPSYAYHPLGLERRRAELLRRVAGGAGRLERLLELTPAAARDRLQAMAGIGPWTAAEATRIATGDPDAVSVGDAHLPSLVAWTLAGETRADDARMLELLEPYAGQRARVVRLLEVSGLQPPRFGPRARPRSIAAI